MGSEGRGRTLHAPVVTRRRVGATVDPYIYPLYVCHMLFSSFLSYHFYCIVTELFYFFIFIILYYCLLLLSGTCLEYLLRTFQLFKRDLDAAAAITADYIDYVAVKRLERQVNVTVIRLSTYDAVLRQRTATDDALRKSINRQKLVGW